MAAGVGSRPLWTIWDQPQDVLSAEKLSAKNTVPPGQDVDMEGDGEILVIGRKPTYGTRTVKLDDTKEFIEDSRTYRSTAVALSTESVRQQAEATGADV